MSVTNIETSNKRPRSVLAAGLGSEAVASLTDSNSAATDKPVSPSQAPVIANANSSETAINADTVKSDLLSSHGHKLVLESSQNDQSGAGDAYLVRAPGS